MDLPQRQQKKRSRISFFVSVVLHIILGVAIFLLAAREGIFGKKMKEITAVIVPKEEKKPEPKKDEPKPEPPKQEAKVEPPKTVTPPPAVTSTAPPPVAAPTAAPPPSIGADFDFNDGAKVVQSTSDPKELYKQAIEYAFRSRWQKPDDMDDTAYVAEAEVGIAPDGAVTGVDWKRGSGDPKWDGTVRAALSRTKDIGRKPPKDFPGSFLVRFDAVPDSEPVQ